MKKKDWLTANDRGTDIRDRPFKHIYCVQYFEGKKLNNDMTSESSARRKSCFRFAKCIHFYISPYKYKKLEVIVEQLQPLIK